VGAAPSRFLHSRRSSRLFLSAAAQGSRLQSGPRKNSYEATPFAYGHTHPPRNSENPELCRKVDSPDAGARLSYLCMKQPNMPKRLQALRSWGTTSWAALRHFASLTNSNHIRQATPTPKLSAMSRARSGAK
jgi:hypothetical protein